MPLPKRSDKSKAKAEEDLAQQKREEAVKGVPEPVPEPEVVEAEVVEAEVVEAEVVEAEPAAKPTTAVSVPEKKALHVPAEREMTVAEKTSSICIKFLQRLGVPTEGLVLDYTAFPTITLKDGIFSTKEFEKFGDEFEFIYMHYTPTWLITGEHKDREPKLCYTDDQLHPNDPDHKDGSTVAEITAAWKAEDLEISSFSPYFRVLGQFVSGCEDLDGELVHLQIPKTSRGKVSAYLMSCAVKGADPHRSVCRVYISDQMGAGKKVYNLWLFKLLQVVKADTE